MFKKSYSIFKNSSLNLKITAMAKQTSRELLLDIFPNSTNNLANTILPIQFD